ncbi:MAG TPA: hypothetical protein VHT49_14735 [Acidimicrobiales bacterium]|nr:hypothetical protein [Acidimicrobiales bacterium]
MPDDDRLLERLGRAFAPAPAEPSLAERRTLHRAVARFRTASNHRASQPEATEPPAEPVIYLPPMILRPAVTALGAMGPKLRQPVAGN